jgi:hypothetical protein
MDCPLRRPTLQDLRAGTPSQSEVPRGGARAFCLLLTGPASGFSKVRRRKGATYISRYPAMDMYTEITESRASSLLQQCEAAMAAYQGYRNRRRRNLRQLLQARCVATVFASAFDLLLILISGAPLNHAGRNSILVRGVNRQGCRFSRTGPWMAHCGGPTQQCRIPGMPSDSEAPSGGARAFCLLLGSFQK